MFSGKKKKKKTKQVNLNYSMNSNYMIFQISSLSLSKMNRIFQISSSSFLKNNIRNRLRKEKGRNKASNLNCSVNDTEAHLPNFFFISLKNNIRNKMEKNRSN